jgi:hypothetical protein
MGRRWYKSRTNLTVTAAPLGSIALGYGLDDRGSRVRFPAGAGSFSLHRSGREADHSPPSSAEVKEYASMAWCSVKAQGQLYLFTLPLRSTEAIRRKAGNVGWLCYEGYGTRYIGILTEVGRKTTTNPSRQPELTDNYRAEGKGKIVPVLN